MRSIFLAAASALTLMACSQPAEQSAPETAAPIAPVTSQAPAGAYSNDPNHTSLTVRVNHLGLSHYTVRFNAVDADLQFDPANPQAMSIVATVEANSVDANFPGDYRGTHPQSTYPNWNADIAGSDRWLNGGAFPQASFRSTGVTLTGANTADVAGELTFRGVTRPITLQATFNGDQAPSAQGPAKVGLSARGSFNRSEFGSTAFLPEPGSNAGIGDAVELIIEAEFVQDSAPAAPAQ